MTSRQREQKHPRRLINGAIPAYSIPTRGLHVDAIAARRVEAPRIQANAIPSVHAITRIGRKKAAADN
jgi:hypothetical protein